MPETAIRETPVADPELAVERELAVVRRRKSCSPCRAKLDRLTWLTDDWFEIEGYRFGARSTSPAFGEWIRYALGDYVVDGPREPETIICSRSSSKMERPRPGGLPSGSIFYEGTIDVVRSFDARAVARSFLCEVESVTFPTRDDAVYVEASIIRGRGGTVLIPALMVPSITAAGRRISRSVNVQLPGHLSIALDPVTAYVVAPHPRIRVPSDALEALEGHIPVDGQPEILALADDAAPIDRVFGFRSGPTLGLGPAPRGPALFELARSVRNLAQIGGLGLTTLGRALADAQVIEARWSNTQQLIDVVAAAVDV